MSLSTRFSCCSHDAKKALRSRNSHCTGLWPLTALCCCNRKVWRALPEHARLHLRPLKALGSDTSTLKDMATRWLVAWKSLLSSGTAEDMPKHALPPTAKQFEIGAYRSMLGAAAELGMGAFQQMCERISFIADWRMRCPHAHHYAAPRNPSSRRRHASAFSDSQIFIL